MASIGERLRWERRRRNLDLAQLADQTKISLRVLEAIEAEEWGSLSGTFFAKSFVRQYAEALGIDAAELVAELERLLEAEKPEPPQRLRLLPVFPRLSQSGFRSRRWLSSLVVLVGVAVCCYGIYALWQRAREVTAPPPRPSLTVPAVTTESTASEQLEQQGETRHPPHVTDQRLSPPQPPTSELTGKLLLNLLVTETTWVSLTVDGRRVFTGILSPGDTKSFEGTEKMSVRTGNAGGLEIHWNGKPAGPVGRRGEVRLVILTREGFQIRRDAT